MTPSPCNLNVFKNRVKHSKIVFENGVNFLYENQTVHLRRWKRKNQIRSVPQVAKARPSIPNLKSSALPSKWLSYMCRQATATRPGLFSLYVSESRGWKHRLQISNLPLTAMLLSMERGGDREGQGTRRTKQSRTDTIGTEQISYS